MKKLLVIFLMLGSVILNALAQPNGGFETWHSEYGSQVPDDWQTFNFLSVTFPPNPISVFKASGIDIHSGNYALKLNTVYVHNNPAPGLIDDTLGRFFTGKIGISPPSLIYGFPYVGRPEKLELWYKYIPVGLDEGGVAIFLRKWNGTDHDTIAASVELFTPTTTYTLMQIDLDYYSTALPDSAIIAFGSSRTSSLARVGSTLYLDDVAFTGWVGIDEQDIYAGKVKVFPNPATDEVNVLAEVDKAYNVKVIDVSGKLAGIYKIQNYSAKINTVSFVEGIYLYQIHDKQGRVLTKGKFNVIK